MNKIIWGQYDAADYPLKHFFYNEIPENIKGILIKMCERKLAVFRGGIAFIFLLSKTDYQLKDLDMLATIDNRDAIIDVLSESDIVYVSPSLTGCPLIMKEGCVTELFKKNVTE